jgi:hypothetical protein
VPVAPERNNTNERLLQNNQQRPVRDRNEQPVNNTPSINPDRNNAPARTFPDNNETNTNQINRNQQQNGTQRNEQPVNNTPLETPQRNIERNYNETPQNNINRNIKLNTPERQLNSRPQRDQINNRSVVPNNSNTHRQSEHIARQKSEIRNASPSRHLIKSESDKKEKE